MGTSKTSFGQVSYSNLLVPGQVSTFVISTPLLAEQFTSLSQQVQLHKSDCIKNCVDPVQPVSSEIH